MRDACGHAIEQMYFYLDGEEISWFHRLRIRSHLRRCDGCYNAYEFETRLKQMIRERGRTEPPAGLFDNLRALIEQEAAEEPEA